MPGKPTDIFNDNPGPGLYNPERSSSLTKNQDPNYSIPKAKRQFTDLEMEIGPGAYNDERKFGDDAITYTIGLPHKAITPNRELGPGYYEANLS